MGIKINQSKNTKQSKPKTNQVSELLTKEITLFSQPFSNKVKEAFYSELSVLLKAGINLKMALELMQDSFKKKQIKVIINGISQSIISGHSLSEALSNTSYFTNYESVSIRIGEETGTLSLVMEQLGNYYSDKNEQKRAIVNALTYPAIILVTAVLVVAFMLNYVVPMFQDIFKQQKAELPYITKVIIKTSEFFKDNIGIILMILTFLIITRVFLRKKHWFKKFKDYALLRIPVLGNFIKTIYLSQFTQGVSLLTSSKVPLVNSISLVNKMIDFVPLNHALTMVESEIIQGKSLSESLAMHTLFEHKMIALVKVAEETNQNDYIFERLSSQYKVQVAQQSKLLSITLQPIIILIIGFFVGIILIAMYLPMFKLGSVMG